MERHHQSGSEDPETGHHVPRVIPGGSADHEETEA